MSEPLASVVVLTWNSAALVDEAIDSALAQTAGPVEVIVADNASVDGTPRAVARSFGDRVQMVCFERNLGYAGGYNRALVLARGALVVTLNPDARLAPDFVARVLPAFRDPRVGIVAPRLMRLDGVTVDSSGQFLARSRKPLDRGYGQRYDAARDAAGPVLSACGAAAVYRRAMIDDIAEGTEFFDNDYFAFHEDLEVGWRAWRAGWKALAVPDAVAVHLRAGGQAPGPLGLAFARPDDALACVIRNRWLAMVRHDRLAALCLDAPFVLARDAALLGLVTMKRPGVLRRLWATRSSFSRARWTRRDDRRRRGTWGPWTRAVPPRGIWRVRA